VSSTDETREEIQLRMGLARDLDAIHPGPAPLEAVLQRSRAVRVRRRTRTLSWTAAALAAAAVVAAVVVPAVSRPAGPQPPTAPTQHEITAYPPSPGAPSGQIATGTVDGVKWVVRAGLSSQGFCLWPTENLDTPGFCAGTGESPLPDPIDDGGGTSLATLANGPYFQFLYAQPQVARIVVLFADGQTLSLRPVVVDGHRLAAFALPPALPVDRLIGYDSDGRELGFTVPFDPEPGQTGVSSGYQGWYTQTPAPAPDQAPVQSSP
jgi:hypothetical protein